MNNTPIHNAARRAAEKIWKAGYDLTTREQVAREISAEYAPFVREIAFVFREWDNLSESAKRDLVKQALEAIEK